MAGARFASFGALVALTLTFRDEDSMYGVLAE